MMNRQSTLILAIAATSLFLLCSITAFAIQQQSQNDNALSTNAIKRTIKRLKPLHTKLGEPKPGQWLETHEERGQSFTQYVRIRPNVLSAARNKLYVQPIGEFTDKQKELIKLSAEYLSLYFNCEVKTLEAKSESILPDSAKRVHPTWGDKQLLTSHILEKVLAPALPRDAFATIAFTSSDLWPGDGWNFVFGYASFRERVGVWSLYRNGDPSAGDEQFKTCLRRTIKIATHETGHMFSMQHCIRYECNMQGSNSLPESDAQPLLLCPECHAKVLYATGAEPIRRYGKLIEFCEKHGLKEEAAALRAAKEKLESNSRD